MDSTSIIAEFKAEHTQPESQAFLAFLEKQYATAPDELSEEELRQTIRAALKAIEE